MLALSGQRDTRADPTRPAVRIGFVLHIMNVAGAEMLVAEKIRRLASRIEPVVFCLDGVGTLGERLIREGVTVVSLGRRPGVDLAVGWRLAEEVRRRRIEILHAHQYTPFFYSALARAFSGGGVRVILTEHGRHYPDRVSPIRRAANRLVLDRLADRITAVCEFSARGLAEQDGFSAERIQVIENGIEVDRYRRAADREAAKAALGLDPARRYVANVARLHPVKGQDALLRGFREVAARRPEADLLFVGDGPRRGELESLARALGIGERVRFLGVRNDVPAILGAIDIFALTSVSEAASLTLLEAMASRLPVVVTAVGGNPEIVRGEVDGLLVPRGDAGSIAAALIRMLEDPAAAAAMGRSGETRVRARYRLDRSVDAYASLYDRLARRGLARTAPMGSRAIA